MWTFLFCGVSTAAATAAKPATPPSEKGKKSSARTHLKAWKSFRKANSLQRIRSICRFHLISAVDSLLQTHFQESSPPNGAVLESKLWRRRESVFEKGWNDIKYSCTNSVLLRATVIKLSNVKLFCRNLSNNDCNLTFQLCKFYMFFFSLDWKCYTVFS